MFAFNIFHVLQALQGKDLSVTGSGSQTRSFQYVSDLVEGLVRLMAGEYSQPVNIGNPVEMTIKVSEKYVAVVSVYNEYLCLASVVCIGMFFMYLGNLSQRRLNFVVSHSGSCGEDREQGQLQLARGLRAGHGRRPAAAESRHHHR